MLTSRLPTFEDVQRAAKRLSGVVIRTSLLTSVELNRETGGEIWVKPECLQLSGSFKIRGAYNRLSALSEAERREGVIAWSSGNHGQGVALAAKMLGLAATIVMPSTAPRIKIERTRSHGATIVFFDPETESREEIATAMADESGAVLVPSFDDPFVMAGQGTSALEAVEDMQALEKNFDAYLAPAGGGGLLAGSSLAFSGLSPDTELFSAEPRGFDDHARSFKAGRRLANEAGAASICDAMLVPMPGELTFAVNKQYVSGGVSVSDNEIRRAMRFAASYLNLVIEPSGAVALAAVLAGKIPTEGRRIGLIATGGNVDMETFCQIISDG